MSIREIARRTGLARNTVKKHLRSEESEPKDPRRVSSSKLDPYAEKLATWLGIEATKSRKQRRTLRQIRTRRRSRTYPHREHLLLTKSVGQDWMERLGQASAQFNIP
jgi:transposase